MGWSRNVLGGILTTPAIWEGIVIGVSAGFASGLLLSVVIWLKNWLFRWVERRDQIRYLAALIENYLKLICGADDIDALDQPIGQVIPKSQVQKLHLDALWRELQTVFSDRASRPSFDEIQQVKVVFSPLPLFLAWTPDDQQYDRMLNEFRTIKWLKLSKMLKDQWPCVA